MRLQIRNRSERTLRPRLELGFTGRERGSDAPDRLLSVTIYISDMAEFQAMNAVWDDWVDGPNAPARTTVEAHMAAPEIKVEMTAIAAA